MLELVLRQVPVARGWTATLCEACFGLALLIGYRTRTAAVLSGLLTLGFALGMVAGVGILSPLNYSVFAISAGAVLLAGADQSLGSGQLETQGTGFLLQHGGATAPKRRMIAMSECKTFGLRFVEQIGVFGRSIV